MKCNYELEDLNKYVSGMMTLEDQEECRKHIESCKICSRLHNIALSIEDYENMEFELDKGINRKILSELDLNRYNGNKMHFKRKALMECCISGMKSVSLIVACCFVLIASIWALKILFFHQKEDTLAGDMEQFNKYTFAYIDAEGDLEVREGVEAGNSKKTLVEGENVLAFDVSADGGSLAYVARHKGGRRIGLISLKDNTKKVIYSDYTHDEKYPLIVEMAWSPKGRYIDIAFQGSFSADKWGRKGLVYDTEESKWLKLPEGALTCGWSPDEEKLALEIINDKYSCVSVLFPGMNNKIEVVKKGRKHAVKGVGDFWRISQEYAPVEWRDNNNLIICQYGKKNMYFSFNISNGKISGMEGPDYLLKKSMDRWEKYKGMGLEEFSEIHESSNGIYFLCEKVLNGQSNREIVVYNTERKSKTLLAKGMSPMWLHRSEKDSGNVDMKNKKTLSIGWEFFKDRDSDGIPSTIVYLKVSGETKKIYKIGRYKCNMNEVTPKTCSWKLPQGSILNCFGWYGGAGDILGVLRKGPDKLVVMQLSIEESGGDKKLADIMKEKGYSEIKIIGIEPDVQTKIENSIELTKNYAED